MRFEAPWVFLILLVIPAVIYFHRHRRGRPSLRFSTTQQAAKVVRSLRQRLLGLPLVLRVLSLVLLTVAIARPQEGREIVRDVSKGVAIEMVVDRSGSMGTEMSFGDEKLNRLEVVKRVFEEFISGKGKGNRNSKNLSGRPNDLIGMIAFARYADTICPLTLAHGALSRFLENVKLVQRRNEDGTAIGDALALAAARLKTAEQTLAEQTRDKRKTYKIKSKIIILLTDGQNNCGKRTPQEAAALAAGWGIKIYTIGVGGGEAFGTVQTPFGEYKVPVADDVDQTTLKALAEATGGVFRMAQDADSLRAIYKEIDRLEKSEVESVRYQNYREIFVPFALVALLLIGLEMALSATVFRRIP
jgi:Ca-activated chloride channel homolog